MLNLGAFHTGVAPLDSTAPPDAFGPFRVLHQIGAGTLGPVFRAYDAGRERLVAVKLFKLDLPPERVHQLVAAFEQLIAADLAHPSMAVPLATGIHDVSAYLAQDYVAAESLDLAVREYGPAPPADAVRVAAQLAGALDFAAVVHIAHGALHPRDVLLSADETRITGLGVARALETVGITAPIRRPYCAPERIAGRPWDRRADVFSLAALMHELLWARRISGVGDQVRESITELAGADVEVLRDVFARALADDPERRFETALDFVDALKRALPEVAIVPPAEPQTAASRSRRPPVKSEPRLADAAPRLPLESVPDDLELRAAGEARFQQVEAAPAVIPADETIAIREERPLPPIAEAEPPVPEPALHATTVPPPHDPDVPSIGEQSRSAVWPLVAALVIGLALGFAAGYGVGTREHAVASATASGGAGDRAEAIEKPTDAPPAAARGREATEVAVADPAKSAPEPAPGQAERLRKEAAAREAVPPPSRRAGNERRTAQRNQSRSGVQRPAPPAAQRNAAAQRSADTSATTGRFSGGLNVDSRPVGARVFLDGRLVGTTPLSMAAVPAGEHAIRLELDGYRRWSSSVRVVAAEQNRVTASLER